MSIMSTTILLNLTLLNYKYGIVDNFVNNYLLSFNKETKIIRKFA